MFCHIFCNNFCSLFQRTIDFLLNYAGNNFAVLFLRRLHELITFQYFTNYINQLFVLDYLKNEINLIFFIFNGFNSLGWGEKRFLLEFSFATIVYEIGFIGLSLYILVLLNYLKSVIRSYKVFDISMFMILFFYSSLNNGLLYNPYALIFLYHYLKVNYENN